jgi:hypothetical protein
MTSFHRQLKRLILDAFSSSDTNPRAVAEHLSKIIYRPCGENYGNEIGRWLTERGIERLTHFTPLTNVQNICKYGLIPREYLGLEIVRLALGPEFTDQHRMDGIPQYNCLSVTFPNYKMFYTKRQSSPGARWAVIEYSADVLKILWAEYCPTNSASRSPVMQGGDGIRSQFLLPKLREELALAPNMTTDPQAEVLCDSVIGRQKIQRICVQSESDVRFLASAGIQSEVDPAPFRSRHDYSYWQGRRITQMPEFTKELNELRGNELG